MKILLDTNILLLAAAGILSPKAMNYIEDDTNTLLFSTASIWEVVIKRSLGRDDFSVDPTLLYSGLLSAGYVELPVIGQHALLVSSLPLLHKDPFDRIMLAQAVYEGIPFLTTDRIVSQYPDNVILIEQ